VVDVKGTQFVPSPLSFCSTSTGTVVLMEQVTLQLSGSIGARFAGYLIAVINNYYTNECLDVIVQPLVQFTAGKKEILFER
jgi:hypothetical protein